MPPNSPPRSFRCHKKKKKCGTCAVWRAGAKQKTRTTALGRAPVDTYLEFGDESVGGQFVYGPHFDAVLFEQCGTRRVARVADEYFFDGHTCPGHDGWPVDDTRVMRVRAEDDWRRSGRTGFRVVRKLIVSDGPPNTILVRRVQLLLFVLYIYIIGQR